MDLERLRNYLFNQKGNVMLTAIVIFVLLLYVAIYFNTRDK